MSEIPQDLEVKLHETLTKKITLKQFEQCEPPRDCRRLNILREYDNEKTNLHS